MTTVITTRTPADLVPLLPRLAGFTPRNSLLLVPFRGKRAHGAMRVDLPSERLPEYAATAIGLLCRVPAVDGALIAVYADELRLPGSRALVHDELVSELLATAKRCGLSIVDALCIAPDRWASYTDDEPGDGTPLKPDPDPLPAHDAEDELPVLTPLERPAFLSTLGAEVSRMTADDVAALDPWRFAAEGEQESPSLQEQTRLLLLLCCEELREGFLAACAGAPRAQARRALAGRGPMPSPERLAAAASRLRRLLALAPEAMRPPVQAALAWLNWAMGRGTRAGHYAEQALREDPGDPLAREVLRRLDRDPLPEWAFARATPASAAAEPGASSASGVGSPGTGAGKSAA